MKTAKEMYEISDNSITKKLSRESLRIINLIQEAINTEAENGKYHLYIPEGHELFPYIGSCDIKKVLIVFGYEIEIHKQQVDKYEFDIIGYTIKW